MRWPAITLRWPFVTLREHQVIVELWRQRFEEAQREKEFYRQAWLDRHGLKFPIPRPAEVTAVNPLTPVTVPTELEQRKTFRLDKSEWTLDDHEWYDDYHVAPSLKEAKPQDELEYWYHFYYGTRKPIEVFLDRQFPV